MAQGFRFVVEEEIKVTGFTEAVERMRAEMDRLSGVAGRAGARQDESGVKQQASQIRRTAEEFTREITEAVRLDPRQASQGARAIQNAYLEADAQINRIAGATNTSLSRFGGTLSAGFNKLFNEETARTNAGTAALMRAMEEQGIKLSSSKLRSAQTPLSVAGAGSRDPAFADIPRAQRAADQRETVAAEQLAEAEELSARQLAEQTAITEERNAADVGYIQATARIKTALMEQGAATQQALVTSQEMLAAQRAAAVLREQGDTAGAAAVIAAAEATAQEAAVTTRYTEAKAALIAGYAQEEEQIQRMLAGDTQYAENRALTSRWLAQQQAQLQQLLAADEEYLAAQASSAASKKVQAAAIEAQIAAEGVVAQENAALAVSKAREKAETEQILAQDVAYQTYTREATVAMEERKAAAQAALAADHNYIAAAALVANANEERAARILVARAGENEAALTGTQAIERAAVLKNIQATQRRATVSNALTEQEIELRVQERAEQAKLNAAIRARERAYIRESIRDPNSPLRGTTFQNIMARFNQRAGGTPLDMPTLGQFAGQKLTTTLGYGLAGFGTGALFFGLTDAVKDVTQMEGGFVRLQGQLQTLGRGDYFEEMRNGIKAIAGETGVSARDVTDFASRMTGVFGDPERAIRETDSAMKLMVITGMDLNTMIQSVVPAAKAFDVSIGEIGSKAVEVNQIFGAPPEQYVEFLGKAGAVSEATGLSLRELTIVSGELTKGLGKDLSSTADVFNKLPALVAGNASKIAATLRETSPQLAGFADKMMQELAAGRPGQAFIQILRASSAQGIDPTKLENMRRALVGLTATRRDAEELTVALEGSAEAVRLIDDNTILANGDTSKLASQWESFRDTLRVAFQRLEQNLSNLLETLASAGITDFLTTVANALANVISLVQVLGAAFGAVSNVPILGDALGAITQVGIALGLLAKGYSYVTTRKEVDARATDDSTVAETRNAESRNLVAGAAAREAEGVGAATAAKAGETVLPSGLIIPGGANAPTEAAVASNAWGRRLAGSRFGQRLFAGSGRLGTALAGGSANMGAIEAGAASSGIAGGVGVVPAVGIALFAALQVKGAYDTQRQEVDQAANGLVELMQKARIEKVREIAAKETDFWSRVNLRLFGSELPEEIARREESKRDTADVRQFRGDQANKFVDAIKDANLAELERVLNENIPQGADRTEAASRLQIPLKLDNGKTSTLGKLRVSREWLKANWSKLVAAAENNDAAAVNILQGLQNFIHDQQGPEMDAMRADLERLLHPNQQPTVPGDLNNQLTMLDPSGAFQAGLIGSGQYISELERQLREAEMGLASAQDKEAQAKKILQLRKQIQDAQTNDLQAQLNINKALSSISSRTPKADEFQAALQIFQRQTINEQTKNLPNLINLAYQAWQERIDAIADPIARENERKKGFTLPPELQTAYLGSQITADSGVDKEIQSLAPLLGMEGDELRRAVAERARNDDITLLEAVERMLTERREKILLEGADGLSLVAADFNARHVIGALDPQLDQSIVLLSGYYNKSADDMRDWIIQTSRETGKTIREVTLDAIDTRIAGAIKDLQDAGLTPEEIENDPHLKQLRDVRNRVASRGTNAGLPGAQVPAPDRSSADKDLALRQSLRDIQKAQSEGNSVAVALVELADAEDAYATEKRLFDEGVEKDATKMNQRKADLIRAQRGVDEAVAKAASVRRAWAEVWARDDPVARTNAQLDDARARLEEAIRAGRVDDAEGIRQEIQRLIFQAQKDQNNIILANLAAAETRDAEDPERLARDQLATARERLRQAIDTGQGAAAIQEAQNAVVAAERAVANAVSDTMTAHNNLLIALANARGDVVGAANLAVQEAQRRLADAQARGAEQSVLDNLSANLVNAQNQALDTYVQHQLNRIDFLLEMGQITTAQAIAQMQVEQAKYQQTDQRWMDIQRKINSLKNSSSADLQFNLPTELGLPTLYEARRQNQSMWSGAGYQDNRTQTITIQVNGAQDPTATAAAVMTAFQSAAGSANVFTGGVVGAGV